MPLILWVILILLSILRLILSQLFPITADESYYWLWSKHLSLSYVDHPPLIAYLNFFFTQGKESLFLLRLPTAIFSFLISIIIYLTSQKLFNKRIAFWSAILFQTIPHFFFIWLTMFVEIPLVLFWALAIYILTITLKENKAYGWYLLIVPLGLGYLSKYTMFLFWPCLFLLLITWKEYRFWFLKKEPYFALLGSFLFFVPVLYWNSQNNWISFTFHGARATTESFGANLLPFIGDQFLQFSPFFLFLLLPVFIFAYKKRNFLFFFSAPILLLFLLLSLKVKIWPHWPSIGYIAAIPLTIDYLINKKGRLFRPFIITTVIFSLLIFIVLFFVDPGLINKQKEYKENYKISEKLPQNSKVFATNHASVAILEFYLKRPVYLIPKNTRSGLIWGEKQLDMFGIPEIKKGEAIILYAPNSKAFDSNYKNISMIKNAKLTLFENYIGSFNFYKLEKN